MNFLGKMNRRKENSRESVKNSSSDLFAHFYQSSKNKKGSRGWHITFMTIVVIVVFITTYGFILPAITIEKDKARNLPGINLASDSSHDEENRTSGEGDSIKDPDREKDEAGPDKSAAAKGAANEGAAEAESSDEVAGAEEAMEAEEGLEYMTEPLTCRTTGYEVSISLDQEDHIPIGTILTVDKIRKGSSEYITYRKALKKENKNLKADAFYQFNFTYQGKEIRPEGPVDITFTKIDEDQKKSEYGLIFHKNKRGVKARLINPEVIDSDPVETLLHDISLNEISTLTVIGLASKREAAEDSGGTKGEVSDNTGNKGDNTGDKAESVIQPEAFPVQSFQAQTGDLMINVEAPEGALPEDTQMRVRLVKSQETIDAVRETLVESLEMSDQTREKVKEIQAADITFTDKEGNEIEPLKPVQVVMASKLVEQAAKNDDQEIAAVHLDDEGKGLLMDIRTEKEQISFEADSFSVYALVKYTSPTIAMDDGKTTKNNIRDNQPANLAEFVTDASLEIEGRTYGAGEIWKVREGVDYALKLTFKEEGSRQFPKGETEMIMDPADLGGMTLIPGQGDTFDIPMGLYGIVTGNRWWVDTDGRLHIEFGKDPNDLLTRSNNTFLNLVFNVNFSGLEGQIKFNHDVKRDWETDTDTDVSVAKSGHYNVSTGKMEYTVTVISTGHTSNIKVTDTFATSNLLTLDPTSIRISPDKELAESGNSEGTGGFTRIIKEMSHGEKVTITYTADVNESALDPNGRVIGDDGKNNVIVEEGGHRDETTNIVHEIKFSDLDKVSTSETETTDGKIRMSWEITANTERRDSLVGSTISDHISWDSKDIMKYAKSDGKVQLHVTGMDEAGNTYSRIIELTPADNHGQESWTWTVENIGEPAGTPLSYTITYDTIVERPENQTDIVTVKNDAENGDGGSDTGVGIIPKPDPVAPSIITKKEATHVTSEYIDWDIVINVPEEGFPDGLTVTDYIPWANGSYKGGNGFADRLAGAPRVSGLTGEESFTWNLADDYSHRFTRDGERYATQILTINFYEDADHQDPGLAGGLRTITISLTTQNDQNWIEYALTQGSGDPIYQHTNNGKVNNTDITAYAIPLKPALEKEHRNTSEKDGLPVYEYMITLSNVTELPVEIEDTFNSEYLEFYRVGVDDYEPYNYIAAAEKKYQLNRGIQGYAAVIEPTGSGKIKITANDLPRKENGSFYEYYRIYYSLKVKDENALDDLKSQALKKGGKYTLSNTAVWENLPDQCDVDYEVKVISKDGYFASANPQERKYTFVVDVNPGSFDLSDGDTVKLTDEHTNNLSVDYSSMKIYRIPAETSIPDAKYAALNNQLQSGWLCAPGTIPWNFVGNNGTFTLADQTHYIIVYDAIVIGSGKQEFKNIADLEGFIAYKEEERVFNSETSAGGDIWEIKLLKYKDGLTSNGLQGATFQLFKGTGEYYEETDGTNTWQTEYKEPMKYGDTASTRSRDLVGKDVTFTTGEDGLVTIRLDEVNDGNELEGGVHYYLKEIDSPAGYQIDSSTEYWSFTLTTDPDKVNYGDPNRRDEHGNLQWIYFYYNDILKMANTETTEPLKVVVNKSWYDKNGDPIAEEDLDDTAVAKVRLMRKTDNGDYVPVKVQPGPDGPVITEVPAGTEESQVQLTRDNSWSYTWNELPRVELGGESGQEVIHRYAYKIEEVQLDGYVVSVSETETETVKTYALKNYKTPDNKTTDVTVKKEWQDSKGDEIKGTTANLPSEIYFELYRAVSTTPFTRVPTTGGSLYVIEDDPHLVDSEAAEGQANYGRYKLTRSDDNWTVTFNNLPEIVTTDSGKTYYYAYYVKEIPLEGYTTSYISEGITRKIVNREPQDENIDIGLEKKWLDGTGAVTTPPQGASAVFTVHQQKSELSSESSQQGDIIVNLIDSNEDPIASVMASDGDQLLLNGYHFKDLQGSGVYAELDYEKLYSAYTGETGWQRIGQLVQNWKGDVTDVSITVDESTMAIDGVITLKLMDKTIADFSVLPVLSNTSGSGSISYSDYEDTEFTHTVVLPTADGKWSTTIRDLIKQDADGNLYRYYITEDSCSPTASSVIFQDQDGNEIRDESKTEPGTDPLTENVRKVEVTNTYQTTDFIFTKEWHDIGDQIDNTWHDDITVSLQRRIENGTSETVGKYTIHKGDSDFTISKDETTPEAPDLVHDTDFSFKLSGLPKNGIIGNVTGEYEYFVTEETVSGYRDAEYSNPSVSSTEEETSWIPSAEYALNNGKIINRPENSVELPASGGSGTSRFYLFGIMLTGLAGAALMMRKRKGTS